MVEENGILDLAEDIYNFDETDWLRDRPYIIIEDGHLSQTLRSALHHTATGYLDWLRCY